MRWQVVNIPPLRAEAHTGRVFPRLTPVDTDGFDAALLQMVLVSSFLSAEQHHPPNIPPAVRFHTCQIDSAAHGLPT